MRLKLRFPDSTEIVTLSGSDNSDETITLQQLLNSFGATSTGPVVVKAGFPPKSVSLENPSATLQSLGISNGEQLVVTYSPITSSTQGSSQPVLTKPAPDKPTSTAPSIVKSVPSKIVKSQPSRVNSKPVPVRVPPKVPTSAIQGDAIQVKCSSFGYLRLRVMEDDNSCLFRAVGFTILKDLDSMFSLRDTVRETILNNADDYSDAILGKPREVYMSWIMQENSWGGAIELDILAKNFGITICSLDVASLRTDMFNPGQDRFVCVVYSGIHYDAVALVSSEFESGNSADDATIFEGDLKGMQVMESLTELGKMLKNRNYYTDTASFSLKCNTCGTALSGEKQATKHAMSTGHTDFGEY